MNRDITFLLNSDQSTIEEDQKQFLIHSTNRLKVISDEIEKKILKIKKQFSFLNVPFILNNFVRILKNDNIGLFGSRP